uniref:Uncharacterized protein n=1 Tax=Leersia perrieri TaxID=77586 RepID=A0A0D9XBQ8_9ORYZ
VLSPFWSLFGIIRLVFLFICVPIDYVVVDPEGVGSEFAADAHAVAALGRQEWYDYTEPKGKFVQLSGQGDGLVHILARAKRRPTSTIRTQSCIFVAPAGQKVAEEVPEEAVDP